MSSSSKATVQSGTDFPALTGFYKLLFLHIEPISTILPAILIWFVPGANWFHHQLVPSIHPAPVDSLDARTKLAVWQLGNCYFLLGLISSIVFRAVRDTLPHDPAAQERIVGASLTALAIADVSHITLSIIGLPESIRYDVGSWNGTTHGNITFTSLLFVVRLAWLAGVGRTTYKQQKSAKAE